MGNIFAAAAEEMTRQPTRMRASSTFGGASTGRLLEDWMPWTLQADWEVRNAVRFMRARARQLVRDNDYAAGFVRSVSDNVIGPDGVLLQAKVKNLAGELATATNKEIERGFIDWGHHETASADGKDSWVDIQRLYIETMATDGEVILRRLKGFDNAYGYALQFIDADLLDETYNVPASKGQNEIRMSVEVDQYNRPLAYHVWTRYPSDMTTGRPLERERVPANEIIHDFVRYRPNQTRGLSWFAPAMIGLHHLDGYSKAELAATRASAGKMGFILNKTAEAAAAVEWDPTKRRQMDVEPGLIDELGPGQEFASFDPTHPGTTFDMFTTSVLRGIGRGLNVSQLTLTGDLRQASYGSMRAGLSPERDHWRALQKFTAGHFLRPVYRDWLSMALLAGALRLDSRLSSNYFEVEWKGRGWAWIDPLKDLQALKMGIDLGVDSRQLANAEMGRNYEDTVDELAYEESYAEEAGVDVSGNQMAGLSPLKVSPEGQQDDANEPHESGDTTEPKPATPKGARRGAIASRARYNFAARLKAPNAGVSS